MQWLDRPYSEPSEGELL